MRPVSKEEFFDVIGPMNVIPRITNNHYPYTSDWCRQDKPGNPVVGKSVGRLENQIHVTDYYLA